MITMQQLEELESRIIKALQLIGDLRAENAQLEANNESLKVQAEEARLSLEEKEQEIARLKKEIDKATNELSQIKQKEEVLEKKIVEMLGKLDTLKSGIPSYRAKPAPDTASTKAQPQQKPSLKAEPEPRAEEDFMEDRGDDEDIIIIDDTETAKTDIEVETLPTEEDEIVLLDDTDDEIIIDDVNDDLIIIDDDSAEKKSKDKTSDDDDFIIIEDEEK